MMQSSSIKFYITFLRQMINNCRITSNVANIKNEGNVPIKHVFFRIIKLWKGDSINLKYISRQL